MKRRFDSFWFPIQTVVLASAIVSPLLFKMDKNGNMNKSLELSKHKVRESTRIPSRHETISSTTYRIPDLAVLSKDRIHLDVSTRQIRFVSSLEKKPVPIRSQAIRGPASLSARKDQGQRLERRTGAQSFEQLPLLQGSDQLASTSFVELDSGVNEFYLYYASPTGEQKTLTILVRYSPKKGGS